MFMKKIGHPQLKSVIIKSRKFTSLIVYFTILFLVVITLSGCTTIQDLLFAGKDPTAGGTDTIALMRDNLTSAVWRAADWCLGAGAIVGSIFFILNAFFLMTALGDKEKIDKAKKGMLWSVVAVVILGICVAVVSVVFNNLLGLQSGYQISHP